MTHRSHQPSLPGGPCWIRWRSFFQNTIQRNVDSYMILTCSNTSQSLLSNIWVNYNTSLTWNQAIWGWFPLLQGLDKVMPKSLLSVSPLVNYWQWHHDKDCNQYHTGLSRIMSTIHRPQRWNSIQIKNSQSNKEKNYQNLNETMRARRCDTTSGHLVRGKPSGSSSEAIQQQFGSSQRQQLSNSQQLSSSLTVVAKYSWAYRSHW